MSDLTKKKKLVVIFVVDLIDLERRQTELYLSNNKKSFGKLKKCFFSYNTIYDSLFSYELRY
jgi:hypothetical protein